jgi:hypothetical protein
MELKVGDKVRVNSRSTDSSGKEGTIIEVHERTATLRTDSGGKHCLKHDKLDIVLPKEYLNEGGKDVSEFKVGDRVECINESDGTIVQVTNIYTVSGLTPDGYINITGFANPSDEMNDYKWHKDRFKLVAKTQTTKENNMNVNSTVAKVFKNTDEAILVTKYLGSEYEEGNHRAYLDLKANDKVVLAEAKRLEKEEKDK